MLRYFSTFFAGVFAMVIPIYMAHGREFIFLILGTVAGVGIGVLVTQLWQERQAERLVNREAKLKAAKRVMAVGTHSVAVKVAPPVPTVKPVQRGMDETQRDVVSALMNFGMSKREAAAVVEEEYVGQGFDELMRKCLGVVRG